MPSPPGPTSPSPSGACPSASRSSSRSTAGRTRRPRSCSRTGWPTSTRPRYSACGTRARYSSARPRPRSSAGSTAPAPSCTGRPATRGTRSAHPAARRAGRRRRWPPGSCPWPAAVTGAAPSASRPASAACSASSRRTGAFPGGPETLHPPLTVVVGCVSRSVRDTARWFDVCNGFDARDTLSLPRSRGLGGGPRLLRPGRQAGGHLGRPGGRHRRAPLRRPGHRGGRVAHRRGRPAPGRRGRRPARGRARMGHGQRRRPGRRPRATATRRATTTSPRRCSSSSTSPPTTSTCRARVATRCSGSRSTSRWPTSSIRPTSSSVPPTPTWPSTPPVPCPPRWATSTSSPTYGLNRALGNNGALTIPANLTGNPAVSIPVGIGRRPARRPAGHRPSPRGAAAARPGPHRRARAGRGRWWPPARRSEPGAATATRRRHRPLSQEPPCASISGFRRPTPSPRPRCWPPWPKRPRATASAPSGSGEHVVGFDEYAVVLSLRRRRQDARHPRSPGCSSRSPPSPSWPANLHRAPGHGHGAPPPAQPGVHGQGGLDPRLAVRRPGRPRRGRRVAGRGVRRLECALAQPGPAK